jgi:hypothetical protein
MSDVEVIPAESDAISRKNSGDRRVARFDNCLSIGEDPIVDLVNGERHVHGAVTFGSFDNFISGLSDFRIPGSTFQIQLAIFCSV